ncbi:DNA polymerase III subunit gamma/tau [Saliterribacillus persicus]|nr:DNA polymerase III subunit gamma/tau [Saliterribacillus persicus]
MAYQALYRVWRPKNFEDVVGQTHITRTLQNAIMQDKFSHAYLFSGPRGTGKTSAAKIFAKAINCEKAPALEPCNACSACLGIQDGSISDVMEIDAASNNGVEQIRDIRDKVKYAPSSVKYKVYIIDEVHMLSIGAFNALLKTLEEPPKHVVFILATTEPHKIPLTIISRCQRFDFKRISQLSMVNRMQTILNQEEIEVSPEALGVVALAAEGGMRDALSLLDQAISYSEERVEVEDVLAVTGSVSQKELAEIIDVMYQQNVQQGLLQVDQLIQDGKDPSRFVYDLIYYLRDCLLYQASPELEDILERAIVDDHFLELTKKVDAAWIQRAIQELNLCLQEIKWTTSPKVFIEVAILKISDSAPKVVADHAQSDDKKLLQLEEKLHQLESKLENIKAAPAQDARPSSSPAPKRQNTGGKNTYKVPYERIRQVLADASKEHLKEVQGQWANFKDALKMKNRPAHATIQNSQPSAASSQAVILSFKYEIHCSLALEHQQTIELLLAEMLNKEIRFIPIPEENWLKLREEYIKKQRQEDPDGEADEEEEEDPLVSEARKLVGEELLEIQD